jgi:hypothetical protein
VIRKPGSTVAQALAEVGAQVVLADMTDTAALLLLGPA